MSLLSQDVFARIEGSSQVVKKGKRSEKKPRNDHGNTEYLRDALENSMLGNPIDENTL